MSSYSHGSSQIANPTIIGARDSWVIDVAIPLAGRVDLDSATRLGRNSDRDLREVFSSVVEELSCTDPEAASPRRTRRGLRGKSKVEVLQREDVYGPVYGNLRLAIQSLGAV